MAGTGDQVRLRKFVVDVEECGHLDVYVQGDLESGKNSNSILLTLAGVGQSYKEWVQFMSHEDMMDTAARSLVLHVCLPGQDEEAEDLPGKFPDLASLGLNLVTVLDHLRISRVVLLGAGAGANIAARFAMNHPGRVQGMLLVDCKHAVASFPLKLKVRPAHCIVSVNSIFLHKNVKMVAKLFEKSIEMYCIAGPEEHQVE